MIRRHAIQTVLPAAALFLATVAMSSSGEESGSATAPPSDVHEVAADDSLVGKIGVVRLGDLTTDYAGSVERNALYEQREKEARDVLQPISDRMRELDGDRDGVEPGSDRYEDLSLEIQLLQDELELRSRRWERDLNRYKIELAEDLFDEVQRAVSDFARQRKLQMVFRVHPVSRALGKRNEDQRNTELVFYDDALDVNEPCRQFLKTWNRRGG